jgi:hypothetical protein
MSKMGRFWNLFLPGLICLNPMGAIAYYSANLEAEDEAPSSELKRAGRGVLFSHAPRRTAVIPLARL